MLSQLDWGRSENDVVKPSKNAEAFRLNVPEGLRVMDEGRHIVNCSAGLHETFVPGHLLGTVIIKTSHDADNQAGLICPYSWTRVWQLRELQKVFCESGGPDNLGVTSFSSNIGTSSRGARHMLGCGTIRIVLGLWQSCIWSLRWLPI